MGISADWLRDSVEKRLIRPIFGFHCVFCGIPTTHRRDLCDGCASFFVPRVKKFPDTTTTALCLNCGVEFSCSESAFSATSKANENVSGDRFEYCFNCEHTPRLFDGIHAPFRYEFPLSQVIQELKYANRRLYGRVLGTLLAETIPESQLQNKHVVGVPMDKQKQCSRGYNQAHDIARWCAADLGLTCSSDLVTRDGETMSLTGLSRQARELEIMGAFRASENVYRKHIVIVDDVLTTGATSRELARELYDAGAASVALWVVARTSSDR